MSRLIDINAVIRMLNTLDRYTSTELTLCDTDKTFPKNEVFVVDDVYEGLEQLPSAELDNNSPKLDNKNGELISRQDAIDALGEEPPVWYDGEDEIAERNQWRRDKAAIESLPSAEPEIIHCKDCKSRGEDECPMRHVERIEWEEDGYIEVDDIVHDYTEPYGYCDKGERNE